MKTDTCQLSIATRIAREAHQGQFRRDGITPYFDHPWRVQKRLESESESVRCAALLHDVLEDTNTTQEDLILAGISLPVVFAVQALTKNEGKVFDESCGPQSYEAYLSFVKQNPIARKVKIADMLDNLSDSPTEKQILKYAKGLTLLLTP